jgi:hypothetical protein
MKDIEIIEKKIFLLTVFGVAMGFLEAVVVVYLRQLYYPEGFGFPLKGVIWGGLFLEYLREIASIVMLISISALAGRTSYESLSYFLYCFGVWDIFYYVGLKVLLNWPSSLLAWDILFLVPVVWVAPVLAPIVCAATMIILSAFMLRHYNKRYPAKINLLEWSLISLGAFAIFITFVWDYAKIIIQGGFLSRFFSLATDPDFQRIATSHVPDTYHWTLFIPGEVLILCALTLFVRRMKPLR